MLAKPIPIQITQIRNNFELFFSQNVFNRSLSLSSEKMSKDWCLFDQSYQHFMSLDAFLVLYCGKIF